MLSGMLEQHVGAYSALLFLVILAGHHSCSATTTCAPSSCGNITNISYPFRLQTDPISCGRKEYELRCENNLTTLYLQSVKYYVQAIDYYPGFTIRLVEADFQNDGCLSIPRHSFQQGSFFDYGHYYPFSNVNDHISLLGDYPYILVTLTLIFISCPNPTPSPPQVVYTSSCKNGSIYSYVIERNDVEIAEVPDLCRIDLIYEASFFLQEKNMYFIDGIHDTLAYGFELSWWQSACDYAKENHLNLDNDTIRRDYNCRDDIRRNSAPIRAAIAFLANRILAYLAFLPNYILKYLEWRLNIYLKDGTWIHYNSFGKPRLEFNYNYKGYGNYTAKKTIYSDFPSILIVLLITLLVILVPIGACGPRKKWNVSRERCVEVPYWSCGRGRRHLCSCNQRSQRRDSN